MKYDTKVLLSICICSFLLITSLVVFIIYNSSDNGSATPSPSPSGLSPPGPSGPSPSGSSPSPSPSPSPPMPKTDDDCDTLLKKYHDANELYVSTAKNSDNLIQKEIEKGTNKAEAIIKIQNKLGELLNLAMAAKALGKDKGCIMDQ